MKKTIILALVLAMLAFSFVGCAPTDDADQAGNGEDVETPGDNGDATDDQEDADDQEKGTVKMAAVNWAEGVAYSNLAKVILEEEMGYDVELTFADIGPIFASISTGGYDVLMESWLPVTHEQYYEEYGDQIEEIGNTFENAKIGLVVPSYVDIDSIAELNEVADKFNGEITGIDPGAGVMAGAERAIEDYNLTDMELMSSSGPMMTAAIKRAVDEEEWVVVTGWKPHWKFARWDLKFLEDPEGSFGAAEDIKIFSRMGFRDDMPVVAQFLENIFFTNEELADLMGAFQDNEDMEPEDIARDWMEANRDLVDSWIVE